MSDPIKEFIPASFKELGFKNVIVAEEADDCRIAESITLSDQQAESLRDEIIRLGDELNQEALDLSQYNLELSDDRNIEWGEFTKPHVNKIKLPVLPKAGYRPESDLSFENYLEQFSIACCYLRSFAKAAKIPQLSYVQYVMEYNNRESAGYFLRLARANCDVLTYWYDRVAKEDERAWVELLFNDWWAVDYNRFVDEMGNPPYIRITGCLGYSGVPIGERRKGVAKTDALLQRLKSPFADHPRLTFKIHAHNSQLDQIGEEYLIALQPIADNLGQIVWAIEPEEEGVVRSAAIDFSDGFVVETHTKSFTPRVSYFLPWFHAARLCEFTSPEAFAEAAKADLSRAETVRTWMTEALIGHLEMFSIHPFHASFGMDDKRLDILLEGLTPHIKSIIDSQDDSDFRIGFYLEKPSKHIWQDKHSIKIPMPHLDNQKVRSFIDKWFDDYRGSDSR